MKQITYLMDYNRFAPMRYFLFINSKECLMGILGIFNGKTMGIVNSLENSLLLIYFLLIFKC